MFNKDFYPTPSELISKMIDGINFTAIKNILEPSAGKGDIIKAMHTDNPYRPNKNIHAIEIEQDLRAILKAEGVKLVHHDFLTFSSFTKYDLIIMNPPFSNGDEHLLKAIEIMGGGGKIVCLLNAETIKNPFTSRRKVLLQKLEKYKAKVEYMESTFSNAERSTDVEVALIKIDMPADGYESDLLSALKKSTPLEDVEKQAQDIVGTDMLKTLVDIYEFEARAGLKIVDEYNALKPYMSNSVGDHSRPILELNVGSDKYSQDLKNHYIIELRMKYWKALFQSEKFTSLFTGTQRQRYQEKVQELGDYEFNLSNIRQIQIDLSGTAINQLNKSIIELFDEFSSQYWDENSSNIHYYNGWKTNKAWKVGKKVITRINAYDYYDLRYNPVDYKVVEKIGDIEKVLAYLDGKPSTDYGYIKDILNQVKEDGSTRNIKLNYISVTFYKKGTAHLTFLDENLLKKFNLIGGQDKGWLPPNYGKTAYEDSSAEMQDVINQFEGKESYQDTHGRQDFYRLPDVGDMSTLLLEG